MVSSPISLFNSLRSCSVIARHRSQRRKITAKALPPISGGKFPPLSLTRKVGPVSLYCALFVFYDLLALRTNCGLTDTCLQELVPAYGIKSMYPNCYATIPVNGTISTTYYGIFPFPIAPPSCAMFFFAPNGCLLRTVFSQSTLVSQLGVGTSFSPPLTCIVHKTRLSRWMVIVSESRTAEFQPTHPCAMAKREGKRLHL